MCPGSRTEARPRRLALRAFRRGRRPLRWGCSCPRNLNTPIRPALAVARGRMLGLRLACALTRAALALTCQSLVLTCETVAFNRQTLARIRQTLARIR